jgi:hypothetical protein
MIEPMSLRPRWAIAAALIAVVFGIVTIIVGGKTPFGGAEERAATGNIAPFVLWFNFVAGFAYVIAGFGLFLWKCQRRQSRSATRPRILQPSHGRLQSNTRQEVPVAF